MTYNSTSSKYTNLRMSNCLLDLRLVNIVLHTNKWTYDLMYSLFRHDRKVVVTESGNVGKP